MSDLLDKETKQFLLVLAGIVIFMLVIYPRISGNILSTGLTDTTNITSSNKTGLNQKKNYVALVSTTEGDFVIDLFEKSAPKNVSNLKDQTPKYANSEVVVYEHFLLKIDAKQDSAKAIQDEINADALGLQNVLVKDVDFLKDLYDPKDPSTKYFSPENLPKYNEMTLKEFYGDILDYNYSADLDTKSAKKYMVYMTSKGPNNNKTDFFVLLSDAAANVDGRFTPVGQVIEGFDVIDRMNEAGNGNVKVNNITVQTR